MILTSQNSYPYYSLLCGQLYTLSLSYLGKCNFVMTLKLINFELEILLTQIFLAQKSLKMCDPFQ